MVDILSKKQRSELMGRVRQKGTSPELIVRRLAHGLGYRFRLHRKDLPGTPDIVFPGLHKVILVHGCFWHGHHGCRLATVPKTRTDFWVKKIETNRERDGRVRRQLKRELWSVLTIWECETRDASRLKRRVANFLDH
ncbi:MAG TPA: DNA mismatch endonuclease Vsr [Hypericibacter adhaerens]|jgi:DNA mismatch endonuclease (patch repair protein)|uniref:very short patch repair endonuclease n=1 Tax=Hypericibacter adhaerens TaxID=2602016 RepID=UPI002C5D2069|nr:DNA mismatch endonuclease Vsr [Hypericibacter adhaerens]HWA43035.1 DNA mismatch endonuclease Vsr [Hypericibacter adhaerens]